MATDLAKDKAPLADVVMCCTSIPPESRHSLATAAEEMGAVHKFDLTSDVTHLVVGDVDTPKYKYVAKERPDVKVVLPSFVDAVREVWIGGSDVELGPLEAEHRVPTFFGLKVCLTGFENASTREHIKQAVVNNGAEFHGDLTRNVTHLIAASPEGKKYEHSRRWNIKIVGIEWLQECLDRGMVLEETLYDPILAPQDRGRDAYNKGAMEHVSLGKRPREEEKPVEPAARRKLRRTMSKRMESQQETIWADMASAGSGQQRQDESQAPEIDSVLGVLPHGNVSAEDTPEPTVEKTMQKDAVSNARGKSRSDKNHTLQGVKVYIHGFSANKVQILRSHLEGNGARVYATAEELEAEVEADQLHEGFVVVPFDVPQADLPRKPDSATRLKEVTEWWVESCAMHKRLIDPDLYPLCKPFPHNTVKGFRGLTVASTGFVSMDLLHVTKAIKLMGADYSEYLKPGVHALICNSASFNKEKLDFAIEKGIKAVNEDWLYQCVQTGVKQEPKDFAMTSETPTMPLDFVPTKPRADVPRASLKGRMLPLDTRPTTDRAQVAQKKRTGTPKKLDAATISHRGPFLDDDEDDEASSTKVQLSRQSRPSEKRTSLRELSQEQQNSQRMGSQSARNSQAGKPKSRSPTKGDENAEVLSFVPQDNDAAVANPTVAADVSQPAAAAADTSQQSEVLNNAIASLLERRQAADARRSTSDPATKADSLGKRRRGLLGRAPSGGSFGSNLSMRASSVGSNVSQDEQQRTVAAVLPDPSQKIIYEDEKAQEERRALIMKMGGKVDLDEQARSRVESIGTVRDAAVTGGLGLAGGRGKRRPARR